MSGLYSIEDCLAMSEDGTWLAFPGEMTRGQVVGAMAAEDGSWLGTLRAFTIKQGFVFQGVQNGDAYYWECEQTDADAIPAWIVKRRGA
jgi:hypothetical protein